METVIKREGRERREEDEVGGEIIALTALGARV